VAGIGTGFNYGLFEEGREVIRKFQRYLETSNWDDILIDSDNKIKVFCFIILSFAVGYFGYICLSWIMS